jgi:hypothetical protein
VFEFWSGRPKPKLVTQNSEEQPCQVRASHFRRA